MKISSSSRRGAEAALLVLAASLAGGCASATSDNSGRSTDPDDEVSVGYGTQNRDEITGSVASVTAEDVGQEVTRFEDLINGRFPGVQVFRLQNGGISLRIRGAASLVGSGEPLIVIDGLPIQSSAGSALMGVNPRDITRIDVLKDAGSTAIYGVRGANGVVLISTRRAN